jgi:DNA-binding Xre family transcriptional regulator
MIRLNLERLLKEKGHSFYWLGKEARINPTVITRMKRQQIKAITLDVLDRICDALGCAPGDVLVKTKEKGQGPKVTKKGRAK